MIDDELLQELLGRATGFYNNGEYKSAIEAWKEALQVDPGSQKAREGIQMATLLLAGCEGAPEIVVEPEPAPPADGDQRDIKDLSRAELDTLLDKGISRVRSLLDERKYAEAVEGARSLVPMDPDSEEVQRLVEDAQQAFEAAPFIEEHLTLARELASQDRFEEAETVCRKVFALDRTNPDAHTLIADLRRRARTHRLAEPAVPEPQETGGSTVKMDLSQVLAQVPTPQSGEPAPPSATGPASRNEDVRAAKEEPLAEPLSSDMFDFDLDLGPAEPEPLKPAAAEPVPVNPATAEPPAAMEAPEASGHDEVDAMAAPPAEGEPGSEVETIDADTVVPPSVRLVPRTDDAGPSAESWLENLDALEPAPPAQDAPGQEASPPDAGGAPGAEASSWEQELESLNLKSGEHDILGRSAARTPTASPAEVDSDLSSLLQEDPGLPPAGAGMPDAQPRPGPPARPQSEERARVATHARTSRRERADEAPPPETSSRRAVPVYFGLLGVLLLVAGGTAWWFFFQPRSAAGQVPSALTPPSASSKEKPGLEPGPIPTPIGSTSKEPVKPPAPGGGKSAAIRGEVAETGTQAPPPAPPAAVAAPAPAPPPRPKTPEELRAEVAHHMSEGNRFLAAEKWREARDEFAAIIALDPVNFQAKELLDQTQERVNQETKVQQDLEAAKSAFDEKDYQGALWKLYRLPRDPRLGDTDLHIRNAWFNWAVLGLKGGDATNALQKLGEALSTDPDDVEATKLQEVAQRYASRPKDKVFYSYVDGLKYRSFDQK